MLSKFKYLDNSLIFQVVNFFCRQANFVIYFIIVFAQLWSSRINKVTCFKIIDFSKNNSIENLTAEINLLPSVNTPSFNFHKNFGFIEIDTVKYSEDYEVSLQKKIVD